MFVASRASPYRQCRHFAKPIRASFLSIDDKRPAKLLFKILMTFDIAKDTRFRFACCPILAQGHSSGGGGLQIRREAPCSIIRWAALEPIPWPWTAL